MEYVIDPPIDADEARWYVARQRNEPRTLPHSTQYATSSNSITAVRFVVGPVARVGLSGPTGVVKSANPIASAGGQHATREILRAPRPLSRLKDSRQLRCTRCFRGNRVDCHVIRGSGGLS